MSLADLAKALAAAQAELEDPKKASKNPHFGSHYADLKAVNDAARAVLPKHGLAISQGGRLTEGGFQLVTTLFHESGEYIEYGLPIEPAKANNPQALCSAITYLRRYGLAAIIGLAPEDEDDDGNAAADEREERAAKEPTPMEVAQRTVVDLIKELKIPGHDVKEFCALGEITWPGKISRMPMGDLRKLVRALEDERELRAGGTPLED